MNNFKRLYLRGLVRELCEKVDGDELILDVFCEVLNYYKENGLVNNLPIKRDIEFIEQKRKVIGSRQTVLDCVGNVSKYLYKVKAK